MKKILSICCLLGALLSGCSKSNSQDTWKGRDEKTDLFLLVGGYVAADQEGVKLYRFSEKTGEVSLLYGMKGIANPSYLVSSVEGSRVYAVSETPDESAAVYALQFDKSAERLTILNRQSTHGADPCYVALNPSCHFVVTANYSGSNVSVFAQDIDGKLKNEPRVIDLSGQGPVAGRQEKSHPHCVTFTPDLRYMLVNDLGADCIHVFPLSVNVANGVAYSLLEEDDQKSVHLESGAGPRHLKFHPNGHYAYLINELSGTVTFLEYRDGNFWKKQTIAIDEGNTSQGAADIHVSPDGKFVYASMRLQHDGIAIFSVEPETGYLKRVGYQPTDRHPRNFVLSPSGDYLLVACRDDNRIQVFKVDKRTGQLTDTGRRIKTTKPSCLQFVR